MSLSICMISYHTCPLASEEGKETGGMNVYVLELSKELVRQGHRVDMFTRCQDPSNQKIVEVMPGLRLIHLMAGPPAAVPKRQLLHHIDEFVEKMIDFQNQLDQPYDVVHAHYYQSGVAALKLQEQGWRQPFVMTFHTLALMKNLVARSENEQESSERVELEYTLTDKAALILAASRSDKTYLELLYGAAADKVHVIPPGVDTDLFRPIDQADSKKIIGANQNEKIILFVGRIEPLKGIDASMYALKMIKEKYPDCDIRLWIVGGDISQHPDDWSSELKKLEQLRKMLHISNAVQFVGQKQQHTLPYYYNAASVVVMPSHYESFGMAVLESMACGTPVVTTNVSGVAALFDEDDQHLITTVSNPVLLAETVVHLLKNPDATLADRLRAKTVTMTWPHVAEQMNRFYLQLKTKQNGENATQN